MYPEESPRDILNVEIAHIAFSTIRFIHDFVKLSITDTFESMYKPIAANKISQCIEWMKIIKEY